MEKTICKNCGAEVDAKFCSQCGQERTTRISLKQISSEVYDGFFNFESPFLKTIICLTINPGKVYREYIEGARSRYFSPVRYSIWVISLMIAIGAITDTVLFDLNQNEYSNLQLDAELLKGFDEFQGVTNSLWLPLYFMSAVFAAGFLRLFFRKEKYTFAELYLPSLLNFSHFTLVYSTALLIGIYEQQWAQGIIAIFSLAYLCWGLSNIYQPTTGKHYLKCLLAMSLTSLSILVLMLTTGFIVTYFTVVIAG